MDRASGLRPRSSLGRYFARPVGCWWLDAQAPHQTVRTLAVAYLWRSPHPDRLAADNIFRWFFFQAAFNSHGPQGAQRLATIATLFVTFENDLVIHTLTVRSPDMQLPVYEVKEFNQRYAIIVFSDNVPAGTLEIHASS